MDPLSDVLSLLRPKSYISGGFALDGSAVQFPKHEGIKCYAVLAGRCWLSVEGVSSAMLLTAGDCFLLPRGLPFQLSSDPSLMPGDYRIFLEAQRAVAGGAAARGGAAGNYLAGGHFVLTGSHADTLLQSLPPMVHLRKESEKEVMRWSLERMREELRDLQPGSSLVMQQLVSMLLVQALRLHLADEASAGIGWLFALRDKQMGAALRCMHDDPGHPWTLQTLAENVGMSRSIFAFRFKEKVGTTPMEYLTHWRMLLAGDRLRSSQESIAAIASSFGYESESAFGKAFKRTMGCSPRQYGRAGSAEPLAAGRS